MSILWDNSDVEIQSLGIDVPRWIEQDIDCGMVASVLRGGCASDAYMPAVTYWQALKTMEEHEDAVLDYLEDCGYEELWNIPECNRSWAGIAVYFVSMAVESWCSSMEEEVIERLEGEE